MARRFKYFTMLELVELQEALRCSWSEDRYQERIINVALQEEVNKEIKRVEDEYLLEEQEDINEDFRLRFFSTRSE